MHFRELAPADCSEYIQSARRSILEGWGQRYDPAHTQPLGHGRYLGMYRADDDPEPIGLSEYYYFADLAQGYRSSPLSQHVDLERICPVEKMGNVRTIYLQAPYRQRFGACVALYVQTAHIAMSQGLEYTTFNTRQGDVYLRTLYLGLGGRLLCSHAVPNLADKLDVYLIRLEELVNQPIARRVRGRLVC
jgi:hypothetical protein